MNSPVHKQREILTIMGRYVEVTCKEDMAIFKSSQVGARGLLGYTDWSDSVTFMCTQPGNQL